MKIRSIYLYCAGPIQEQTFDLTDAWTEGVHDRILFTGPNGSGKSTILRAVAQLWKMVGEWLATPGRNVFRRSAAREWLQFNTRAVGLILDRVPGVEGEVGIYYGPSEQFMALKPMAEHWIGEAYELGWASTPDDLLHSDASWLEGWSKAFSLLTLSTGKHADKAASPNIVYLEAEERRWRRTAKDPKQLIADDPAKRWLVDYQPTNRWDGQLEMSLLVLKTLDEGHYKIVLQDINRFLAGKEIRYQPTPELRLMVDINGSGRSHLLDDLSTGERQVLIQFYLISRWLQPGGVVLLDEPDLHLHPSLIRMFLGRLEAIVAERQGQLILTTHLPELWHRYETAALRISLGGGL